MSNHDKQHITPYSMYVIVWLGLLALTTITVTVAGISLGKITIFIALAIAAIKSALVINIFMHIKFEEAIFKVFLLVSGMTLLVIFVLTFVDFTYR
ncbi:MAG: cytochrome-c oxidase [Ignavibacteriae bacterium HGW-Ignavibacteriae-2]|jgi:cytochrome c oxidase subunit 4|nr:cytochrome C oxidase subunit IV family protein [Bacteroidota bacterium]PKL87385.1 MAG: cytochrome-c oxidase [Ignavibacteriae bacterium HGW-Ignavibacteriae-2]